MPTPHRTYPIPKTCLEAAGRFRTWAQNADYKDEASRHYARAEILAAFGLAPVPESILRDWNFETNP
jgi:hypothetical protein